MEQNGHKSDSSLSARLGAWLKRPFVAFCRLFSSQKPTSLPINEIPAPDPRDTATKKHVDGVISLDDPILGLLDDETPEAADIDIKEGVNILKEYTEALKETTHELKRLQKVQKEMKSFTKQQIEAKRAENKRNLSKKGNNVASRSSKDHKKSENKPKPAKKGPKTDKKD